MYEFEFGLLKVHAILPNPFMKESLMPHIEGTDAYYVNE